ncbi:MAG: hypothetical protein CM15mP46_2380 [Alphaproteobacteria bacterium]|nr:MAG: hypothetical protein CM15mP46_2380 [Alphaproteobacteria bacterium]
MYLARWLAPGFAFPFFCIAARGRGDQPMVDGIERKKTTKTRPTPRFWPPEPFPGVVRISVFLASTNWLADLALHFFSGVYTVGGKGPRAKLFWGARGCVSPKDWVDGCDRYLSMNRFCFLDYFMWTPPHFWALW